MNYEEKSDLEIAARALTAKGIPHKIENGRCFINHGYKDGACIFTLFDPCNNPSDAWSIIFENKISIGWFCGEKWRAEADNQFMPGSYKQFTSIDENPLRAAMICFLKMKDAENE